MARQRRDQVTGSTPQPILAWEGCLNARDVGGLRLVAGGQTSWNSLLRADSLGHLGPSGVAAVRRSGVSRIIDLRFPGEGLPDAAHAAPHPFAKEQFYRRIPLFEPGVADLDPEVLANGTTGEIYCASADVNGARIASAVSEIASAPPGAVVVHCAEGKDRTGIVVALVLAVVGVGHEQIAEDYAASAGHLSSRFASELAAEPHPGRRDVLRRKQATDPATMLTLLGHLDSRYGDVAAYLRSHGVVDAQLSALRDRLISAW